MADKINLDDLKNRGLGNDPFPAPEGYFDDLSERIQQRIAQEDESEKQPTKVVRLAPRWYYAAAAVAVLGLAIWLINPFRSTTTPVAETNEEQVQTLLADVSSQEMIDYLQMSAVDVTVSVSLTEEEQEELLEAELETFELPEDYYLDTDYLLEEYL
ncbi:MAG: hypothetical protein AAF992_03880 [Bacteroidota bacterium]